MADKLVKYALQALAVLFVISGIGDLFLAWQFGLFFIALGGLFWYWSGKGTRGAAKAAQIVAEARSYFETVNKAGEFPASSTSRIISRDENPVLAACNARLLELTADHARNYLGTRVKVGSLPIYLGRSASSGQHLRETAAGELAITPRELIFSGTSRSVDIPLDKITSIDIAADGFHLSVKGRQKPLVFIVPNGVLWGALVKNVARITLDGRRLPAGSLLALE